MDVKTMPLPQFLKISRKTFFNPIGWFNYEEFKNQNRVYRDVLKGVFTTAEPLRQESFKQAIERLGLTEQDLANGIQSYRWYALLFTLLGLAVFLYSWYLLFSIHTFTGFLLGLAASALFFGHAFKYDFWAFQMQQRKLGATFAEWKSRFFGQKRVH